MKVEVCRKMSWAEFVFDNSHATIKFDVNDKEEAVALCNTLLNAIEDLKDIFELEWRRGYYANGN
jgi:hypothetical protein